MCKSSLAILFLWLSAITLPAQTTIDAVPAPSAKDFTGILSFLSSDWMEGREAGARGGFMAADYIASLMRMNGLLPYGDAVKADEQGFYAGVKSSYFQNFQMIRSRVENSSIAIIRRYQQGESALLLNPGIDFKTDVPLHSLEAESPVVFAGYGIETPGKEYNDYAGIDVKGLIIVILDGFPGHADTTSQAWKKLGHGSGQEIPGLSDKLRIAKKHGAIAVIYLDKDVLNNSEDSLKPAGPFDNDPEYYLPGDTSMTDIPCVRLKSGATRLLFRDTGIDLPGFEKKAALYLESASAPLKDKIVRLSVEVRSEVLTIRNVLGMIRGSDTTRNIIVGAHYDHLGIRNGLVFNGADDNASGVAGMLSLAGHWAGHNEKPACNIIFAAWTAEEKGLLGSEFFARHSRLVPGGISLVINLDMISGSAPEDTARQVISIGTLPVNEVLRKLAGKDNAQLEHPFTLDLWDVTGHSGSDYGPFASRKIPVMTFFSGFTDDYHTPRDVAGKSDPGKMEKILKIVNSLIGETCVNPPDR